MRVRAMLLGLMLIVAVVGCTDDDGGGADDPDDGASPATTAPLIDYEPEFRPTECGDDVDPVVECGQLVVPEDRSDPDSRNVRLAVAIVPARSADPAPDPVVVFHGGPGGSLLGAVDDFAAGELAEDRDVILFDQRGAGVSRPNLRCPDQDVALAVDLPLSGLGSTTFQARQQEALAACRQSLVDRGVDPDHYDTTASAADVADLRQALGIDEWNLFGVSYGTRLALAVLRDHPEGVRSVVLDSVYPPEIDQVADNLDNLNRSLGVLFEACIDQEACAVAYPDLEATWQELLDRTAEEPFEVTVTHPVTGDPFDMVIDDDLLSLVAFGALYDPPLIEQMPFFLEEIAAGRVDDVAQLIASTLADRSLPPGTTPGAFYSGDCADDVAFTAGADYEIEFGLPDEDSCAAWDVPPGALGDEPITSDVPTLVLAGAFDPVTPPAWSEAQADRMANSTYVEFPFFGHSVITSTEAGGCARELRLAFLDDPTADLDTACAADQPPLEFRVP